MNFLPIAASSLDTIIGIVAVIGWILIQVLGRKKNGESGDAPPPSDPSGNDPQDELRKFFEEMEKTLKPEPPKPVSAPSTPPPLVPPPLVRNVRPKREPNTVQAHNSRMEPSTLEERPLKSAEEAAQAFMKTVSRAATIPRMAIPEVQPGYIVPDELRDPVTLRKMIVTMEVLGKPVALRTS